MENVKVKEKGIPGSTLKIIAIISMFIDHFGAMVIEQYMKNLERGFASSAEFRAWTLEHPFYDTMLFVDLVFRLIGRLGFPLFCFLLVEGFMHTRSVKKYALNLALFSLISEIPFDLALHQKVLEFGYQNVYFTLCIGLLTLAAIKWLTEQSWGSKFWKVFFYPASLVMGGAAFYITDVDSSFSFAAKAFGKMWKDTQMDRHFSVSAAASARMAWCLIGAVLAIVVMTVIAGRWSDEKKIYFAKLIPVLLVGYVLAEVLHTDYAGYGVLVIVVMYLLKNQPKKQLLWGSLILTYMGFMEATALFTVIPAKKYNGKRGLGMKYFFYAFYPGHILLFYLITKVFGLV